MTFMQIFLSAIFAGASIASGGAIFLLTAHKVLGALLFSCGLFCVCEFGFHLFTGKVCYAKSASTHDRLALPVIYLGNLVGTLIFAGLLKMSRLAPALTERAVAVCNVKCADSLLSLFVLGMFCNVFVFIGVEGFKSFKHELGKYIALFFGVVIFVASGYEHCVADMFYIAMAGWNAATIRVLLAVTAGNIVGGFLFAQGVFYLRSVKK